MTSDIQNLWKTYLYTLQIQAPKPKTIFCENKISDKPSFYGNEYHGKLSRENANKLLDQNGEGSFLVRESERYPGTYTLCLKYGRVNRHYKLYYDGNHHYVRPDKRVRSLRHLVADGLITMHVEARAGPYLKRELKLRRQKRVAADKHEDTLIDLYLESSCEAFPRSLVEGSTALEPSTLLPYPSTRVIHYQNVKDIIPSNHDNSSGLEKSSSSTSTKTSSRRDSCNKNSSPLTGCNGEEINKPRSVSYDYTSSMIPPSRNSCKVSPVEFITTCPPTPFTENAVKIVDGKSDDVSSASANTMMAAVVTGDCLSSSAINNNNNALYANYEIVIKYQQGEHQLTKTCDDIQLNRNSHQQTILNEMAQEKIISNDKSNRKVDDNDYDKQQSNCNPHRQTILNERAGKTISNGKSRRKADDNDDKQMNLIRHRQTILNETEEEEKKEIINDKSNRKADDNDDDKQQLNRNCQRHTISNETEADEIDKIRRKADDNDSIGEGVVMRKKEKPVVIYENGSSEEIFLKRFYPVSTTVITNTIISLQNNKSSEHSSSGWAGEYKLCENPVYAYPSAVLSPASYNNDTKTKPMMSSCIRSISNPSSEPDQIRNKDIDFMDTSEALLRRQPATIKEHHQQLVNFKKSSAPPIPSSVIITNDVLSVNNNKQRTRLVSSTVYCGGRSNPKTNSTVLTLSDLALPHRQHHSRNAVYPISLTEEDMTTAQVLLTPYNTCRLPNNHASGKPFFSSFSHNRKDNNTNYYKPEIPNDSSASSLSSSPNPNFFKKATMTAAASAAAKNHYVRNSINFFERSSVTSSFKYSQQRPSLKLSSAFLPSKQPLENIAATASYSLPPQNGLASYSFALPPPPSTTTTTPFHLNSSCSNITMTVHSTSSLNYVNCYSSAKLGIADDNNHNFSITSLQDDSSLLNGGTVSDSVITNSFCGGDYDDTRCTLNTSIYDEEAEGENKIGEVVVIKKCKEILRDRKRGETSDPESYGRKRSLNLQNSLSGDCDGFTTDEIPSANEISRSKSSSTSSSLSQLSEDGNYESSLLADQRKHSFKTRTFKSLKWCDICGDFMWGLISQGVKCNECGICAHTRCSRIISNTSATNLQPDPRGFCNRNTCKYLKNRVFGVDITAHLAALRRRAKRNDYYHIGHDSTNQLKPSSQKDMLLLGESHQQHQQNYIKLTTSSPKFSTKIPIVLQVCCKLIEKYGIDSEGIYRIPGSSEDVEKFRQLFDNGCEDGYLEMGKSFDIFNDKDDFMTKGKGNFKYKDINLVASVLKLYLRLLPIPLITFECYDTFLNALKHENICEIVDALQIAVRGLPNAHYTSLKYIMLHLKKISDHESKNLMGPSNLAMIFAPNIIKNGDPSSFCMLNDSAGSPVGGCGANPPNFFPPSFQTNSHLDQRHEQQTNKSSKPNKHHSRVQQTNSNNNNTALAPPFLNNGFQQLQPQEESSALTTKAGGGATMQDYFSTLKLECRVIEFLIIHVDQIFNLSSIPS